jgi:Domain of unknown function (DUF5134)
MGAPIWLTASFAALMLTVATYCAGRLAVARRWQRPTELDTDAGHVLMGLAMAGLLVSRLRLLPAAAWEPIFAAGAAWFAWQLLRSRRRTAAASWRCLHPAPHLVECAAMLYMFFAATPLTARAAVTGMTALPPSRFSVLALLMALFMVGYVVRVADRLPPRTPTPTPAMAPAPAPTPAMAPAPAPTPAMAPAPALTAAPANRALAFAVSSASPAPTPTSAPSDALTSLDTPATPETSAPAGYAPTAARPQLAPRCAALCKIAMGLTMAYMLVLML